MKLVACLVLLALVVAGSALGSLPAPLRERLVGPVVRATPLSPPVPLTTGWSLDLWATWPWAVRPRRWRWRRGLRCWYRPRSVRRWSQLRRERQALLRGQAPGEVRRGALAPPSAVALAEVAPGGSTALVVPNAPAAEGVCAPAEVASGVATASAGPNAAASEGVCPPSQRRGRQPTIPTAHLACPHEGCKAYGCLGSDPRHHLVGNGTYPTVHGETRQLFLCQVFHHSFSETAGMVFFGLKHPAHTVCVALQACPERSEGNWPRGWGCVRWPASMAWSPTPSWTGCARRASTVSGCPSTCCATWK